MAKTFILAVCLLVVLCKAVDGQFVFDCDLNHNTLSPQSGIAPVIVATPGATQYTPGSTTPIMVFVAATNGQAPTNIIIRARSVVTDSPVGAFQPLTGFQVRPQCADAQNSGTFIGTNNDPAQIAVSFSWVPPAEAVGNIIFEASVVQGTNSLWTGLQSAPLIGPAPSVTPCDSNPCLNGGICTNTPPVGTPTGFSCTCFPGFSGTTCEIAASPCQPNPCLNGGSCLEVPVLPTGFFCNCIAPFTGATCADGVGPGPLEINPCPPIINNVGGNFFTWTPPSCSRDGTVLGASNCNRQPGVFMGTVNQVTCTCTAGDDQATCPFNINATPIGPACTPNPCAAGLDCQESTSALAGYTCHITTGSPCPVN